MISVLVSFFSTKILASFIPKYNTCQCVAGGISLPEHHYPQTFCQGITLHGHSWGEGRGERAVPILSLELADGEHQLLGICLHLLIAMCLGELVKSPCPAEAAENFTANSCPTTDLWLCFLLEAVLFYLLSQS